MDATIFALLVQDGVTNGSIYALLALALVLVFTVTRVIFVPSGEFVVYGTLTLAGFDSGNAPPVIGLLIAMALIAGAMELRAAIAGGQLRRLPRRLALWCGLPIAIAGLAFLLAGPDLPFFARVLLALALVTAMGPLVYRIAFQPLADASVLVLLIVAVAVHLVLTGLGLWFFGAEGSRTSAFTTASFDVGAMHVSGESLLVVAACAALIATLSLFSGRTLYGKALRAAAGNRIGARLCGIAPEFAGALTFTLAALLCALSGILIGPITTVYYDSGFVISLKGFVGAIIGGLSSYPAAAAGALFVGGIESFASFFASGWKEVIVFTLIIPVLLWRSLTAHHHDEDD